MENMIHALLEQSKWSWKIYEEMQEKQARSEMRSAPDCMVLSFGCMASSSDYTDDQIIADNCIQMAAVNWCKVFASKKSKTYYVAGIGINRKLFLSVVEARGISFQGTCDKMRSFRDKYTEGEYSREEIRNVFEAAMGIVEEYEKASIT